MGDERLGASTNGIGRRWSMIIAAFFGVFVAPVYLLASDPVWVSLGFIVQGFFAGAIYGQNPSYLSERFPTEVRSTASGFCYHQGAIWGGFVAPILSYFAISAGVGIPMLVGTIGGLIVFVITLLYGPETKGALLVARPRRCQHRAAGGLTFRDPSPGGAGEGLVLRRYGVIRLASDYR
jgi:SHS family lactate transporter-like MFS transporter